MNEYWYLIVIVVAAVLAVVWFVTKKAVKQRIRIPSIEKRVWAITRRDATPRGCVLLLEDGVTVPDAAKLAIDVGLARAFEKARCAGYTRTLNHSDYQFALLKSTERTADGFPAYRLPVGQYIGTEFDKGGFVLVSGQMVFLGEPYGNVIAAAEHVDSFAHLHRVAEFEAEHVILGWNDGDKFERTLTHSDGRGHPIIADCDGSLAGVSAERFYRSMRFADYVGLPADK